MIRIVIIDEYVPDLNRIRTLLAAHPDFEVVGAGQDGYDALRVVSRLKPDIVVLDVSQSMDGAEWASLLKRQSPKSSIILFAVSEHDDYIRRAISSDVSGYLLKKTDIGKLAAAIRCVSKGSYYINARITDKVMQMLSALIRAQNNAVLSRAELSPQKEAPSSLPPGISRTELKIIVFLAQGRSNKEIAANLCLKIGTVRNYVSSAMRKAGLHNRTEVAIFALRNGLV